MMWNFNDFENNTAIIDDNDTTLTYKQLEDEILKIKSYFNKKSLVFVLCDDKIGNIIAYVSLIKTGNVPIMLNSELDIELFVNLYQTYKPQYMFVPSNRLSILIDTKYDNIYTTHNYCLIKTYFSNDDINLYEDLALLLTTSGSTGSPKFVRQSYKNIFSNADSIVSYLKLTSNEKPITTLPMNYTYALSIINSHLLIGATVLVTNKSIVERDFWSFFKKYGATSFGGVPYTFELLKKLRFFNMELPTLKTITQAGGKLSLHLHQEYSNYAIDNNKNFVVMYGQCEATARIAYLPHEDNLNKIGSIGIPIPNGELKLIDDNDNFIDKPNVSGELIYYGDNVTLGYAENRDDLSKGDERVASLKTGDIAYFDNDGYFFITGRKKRFVKIFGNRVNLDEAEGILKGKFKDIECACAGKDDLLLIFTTVDDSKEDMRKYLSSKINLNSSAFKSITVTKIPKNESGKVLYKDLENLYD